ncbi:MAG TPA: 30S ribosomal protein S6 [Candidatus Dependentiae bacterium]|nr:30S ribosomal protein S6 [Candidatus Dependentiae bacterium]
MSLRCYELLLLTVPEITSDESKNLEKRLNKFVLNYKGSIISFERWGKYRLVYPVKKNDYGIYYLFRFEIPRETELIQDVKTLFNVKLNNIVMRNMFTYLDEKASLAYQRPKSLEEVPTRDVETFLKENKMEGLLSAVDSPQRKGAKEDPASAQKTKKVESNEQNEDKK